MSDYEKAFNFMMGHEDSLRAGNISKDPTEDNPNAYARFGINSDAHPEAVSDGFYGMPIDQALEYAASLYKYRYWVPIGGYQIIPQDIANKYFDLAVNSGPQEATKIVQRSVNCLMGSGQLGLAVDGKCGQRTIDGINQAAPEQLLPVIKGYAIQFYQDVAHRRNWSALLLQELIDRANS